VRLNDERNLTGSNSSGGRLGSGYLSRRADQAYARARLSDLKLGSS
jgi:hypothetical protein